MAKFQLTCQIDGSLIGPLTELIAPYGRVSIKLVEGETVTPLKPARVASLPKRRSPAFMPTRGTGPIATLKLLSDGKPHSIREIKAVIATTGAAPSGSSAILSKLKQKGLSRWVSDGMWQGTPKGEALVHKLLTGMKEVMEHESAES